MIIDSSAMVAILLQEEGHEALIRKLVEAGVAAIGAPTLVETAIVLSARLDYDARALLSRFLTEANVAVIPFTEAHFGVAVGAWIKYGKGRHPAGLNLGDCMSYAASKFADMPLLCVGEDFPQTDLLLA